MVAKNSRSRSGEYVMAQEIDEAVMNLTGMLAQRAKSIPDNPFASADARVAAAMAQGADVIDLSKGNPDGEPPEFMIEAAVKASHDPADFRYAPFDGKPAYLQAAAHWYRQEHGVALDPVTQLLAVSGASVGIGLTIQTLVNPDDLVLVPVPTTRSMKVPRLWPRGISKPCRPMPSMDSFPISMRCPSPCGNGRSS